MECLETFLREYNSVEESPCEKLGFFHVSNDEIEKYNLEEECVEPDYLEPGFNTVP